MTVILACLLCRLKCLQQPSQSQKDPGGVHDVEIECTMLRKSFAAGRSGTRSVSTALTVAKSWTARLATHTKVGHVDIGKKKICYRSKGNYQITEYLKFQTFTFTVQTLNFVGNYKLGKK